MKPIREIALDIETAGHEIDYYNLSEATVANLQAKYKRQRTAKTEEDWTAVDPDLNQIICISMYDGTDMVSFCSGLDELEILEKFWDFVAGTELLRLVTFNGKGFDVPSIIKKSIYHGILPSRSLSCKKYDERTHCDLMGFLSGYIPTKAKPLSFYCDSYGIENGLTSGSTIRAMYDGGTSGRLEIEAKCEEDVRATYYLYQHVKPFL